MGAEGEGHEEDKRYQMLHPLKARLHLLHKNVKACKKEVKSITSTGRNVRNVEDEREGFVCGERMCRCSVCFRFQSVFNLIYTCDKVIAFDNFFTFFFI